MRKILEMFNLKIIIIIIITKTVYCLFAEQKGKMLFEFGFNHNSQEYMGRVKVVLFGPTPDEISPGTFPSTRILIFSPNVGSQKPVKVPQ